MTQQELFETQAVLLLPIIQIGDLGRDARCSGAYISEKDGVLHVVVIFKNPPNTTLFMDENDSLRKALKESPNFFDEYEMPDQPYLLLMYKIPDQFEKDMYLFCSGNMVDLSQEYKKTVVSHYPHMLEYFQSLEAEMLANKMIN
jgi:hypothetical protein